MSLSKPLSARSPWLVTKTVWYALILRELQTLLWSRRFGGFWLLAEPIAHITLMMLMFTYIRERIVPGVPFALFLLTGLIPFFLIRGGVFGIMGAVSANQALFTYRQIKPFDTFVARTAVQILTNASVYLVLVFLMVQFLDYSIPVYRPIEMVITSVVMVLFAFALGLLLCLLVDTIPDVAPIIRLLFFPLYLISGIIFPLRMLPPHLYDWVLWNPILHLIDVFRQYSLEMYTPLPGVSLLYPSICTVVMLFISVFLYNQRKDYLVTE